jgi:hypothetical protein
MVAFLISAGAVFLAVAISAARPNRANGDDDRVSAGGVTTCH